MLRRARAIARYVVRLLVVGGKLTRWAVALQVRRRDGRFRDIVRYDDWHGPLHRRRARFAPRKPDPMEDPPPRVSPIRYAVGDILINADVLLAVAQKDDELEVEDDASDYGRRARRRGGRCCDLAA
jgi:hypothetical protein